MSRDAPPPLPGGYKMGEKIFFTGTSHTLDDGYKVLHSQQGKVTGPFTCEDGEEGVAVLFPGNTGSIDCLLNLVRRRRAAPAPTPHPPTYTWRPEAERYPLPCPREVHVRYRESDNT